MPDPSPAAVTEAAVLEALSHVMDPDLGRDIVALGFVKELRIDGGSVAFDVELTTPACPVKDQLREECEQRVRSLAGVEQVAVNMTANVTSREHSGKAQLEGVRNVLAVASGKGGVGKSTCSVNLALALADAGARVGLMDADVYGPSIPMMLGVDRRPQVTPEQKIVPIPHRGLSLMSMGFLSDESTPVIWRGPMVASLIQQFLNSVQWGKLDYLVVDMPPGTGDVALTLTQTAPLSGAVIVTTPQEVSILDARKGLKMFEKVNVPVLGVIENMSWFEAPGGQRVSMFGEGGGRRFAEECEVPLLGEIPIEPAVAKGGDVGEPIFLREPQNPVSQAFRAISRSVAAQLAIANANAPAPAKVGIDWDMNKGS